ncbi:EscU/YscU/HrcU family type III secretion system export apparatus switch protein [Cellulomonas soli]|uniref:Flagellar biosynthesis protein FlhB n=1 Tax=Cellulomonas soli TaxID=931535 RepID=A0A512PEL7_9CELL|nr:EscU/YscU/HrcU family type III secretion system export apparatus switch protein [Cellulomonas soli]NYI59555.1 flagellar biosynthetic protein FlhB [Cellulomonas soli]GEP69654.1 flagellar biosynthesis protein FlhB [Cellulomonas soli]
MSDGQERTQKATPQRMKELRRKGGLSTSQDMSAWVGLGVAVLMIPGVISRGKAAATDQLAHVRDVALDPASLSVTTVLGDALRSVVPTLAPMFVAVVVAAIVVAAAQGGIHVRKLKLHVEHLNPTSAAKRLLGPQSWWQGAKTLLKTGVVALVLLTVVQGLVPVLTVSGRLPLQQLVDTAAGGTTSLLRFGIVAGVLLAVADLVVVMRRNRKQTRMTLLEVKEEHKKTEGDPQVKGAIRAKQMAMSRNRMMAAVAQADVVLVNPTHVAVALRYEPGSGAPKVVAKGAGALAARIRAEASEHRVPLVEDIPLARALHAACEVGQEIPEYLFTAVARVLAFVMALRRRGASTGQHRVPGGSALPTGAPTDHRAAAREAKRRTRAARAARRAPAVRTTAVPTDLTPTEDRP